VSVAIVGVQELADAATLAALGAPEKARQLPGFFPGLLLLLERFSVANVTAYRRSYVEGRAVVNLEDAAVKPIPAEEIFEAVRTIPSEELVRSFLNLHHNAIAQDGTDFLPPDVAPALRALCAWAGMAKEALAPLPEVRRSKRDPRFYGSRYDEAKNVGEIPALIRKEIKFAVSRGELPRGKYSVRKRRSTHSWAIDVTIADLGIALHNPKRLAADPHTYLPEYTCPRYTPEAKAVISAVEAIVASFNHDGSDSQSDYFDVRFYGSIDFDHEWEAARKEVESRPVPPCVPREVKQG
jgi:hypothetical protein